LKWAGGGGGAPPTLGKTLCSAAPSGAPSEASRPLRLASSSRRLRRFVTWLAVSYADRDLVCQDRHVFSGWGFAPASSSGAALRGPSARRIRGVRGEGPRRATPSRARAPEGACRLRRPPRPGAPV